MPAVTSQTQTQTSWELRFDNMDQVIQALIEGAKVLDPTISVPTFNDDQPGDNIRVSIIRVSDGYETVAYTPAEATFTMSVLADDTEIT